MQRRGSLAISFRVLRRLPLLLFILLLFFLSLRVLFRYPFLYLQYILSIFPFVLNRSCQGIQGISFIGYILFVFAILLSAFSYIYSTIFIPSVLNSICIIYQYILRIIRFLIRIYQGIIYSFIRKQYNLQFCF